jgi:hypothetical protein
MQKGSDARGETVSIAATLQKDGIYPLTLSSGVNGANPGQPVSLSIQPGAPFWYRLGSEAPQFHDGSKELVLQPIHLGMGKPGVRLVALGRSGGETFNATLSRVDLQGAWLIIPGQQVGGDIACLNDNGLDDTGTDKYGLVSFPSMAAALGDFRPDAAGDGLTWTWNRDRLPAELAASGGSRLQFEGAALAGVDQIQVQGEFQWLRATSRAPSQLSWTPLFVGVVVVAPGIWGWRRRLLRPYAGLLGLFLGILLLTGCEGVGFDFWGGVGFDAHFTRMEYLGGQVVPVVSGDAFPDVLPLWKLNGTAEYDVDFYVQITGQEQVEGSDEMVQVTSTTHCTGKTTYEVEARIFEDVIIASE